MENYEQKYKEALARANAKIEIFYHLGNVSVAKSIEEIFPELKESEDERIRKELIHLISEQDGFLTAINGISVKNIIAWLEKQGEQKPQGKSPLEVWKDMRFEVYQQASGNRHEPNCSDDSTKMFSLTDIDEIFEKISEKQGEPKPIPEPKFKAGDFITDGERIFQIEETIWERNNRNDGTTYCESLIVNLRDGITYANNTDLKEYHLWTIEDAKEGDILEFADHGRLVIGIVSYVNKVTGKVDANCLLEGNNFKLGNYYALDTIKPHPATKEQRDLLFQKMHEAGYEWDVEKKELKKIDQSFYYNDGLYYAIDILGKTLGKVEGYQSDDGIIEHQTAI